MTLNDLKNELSALGFERDISIDKSLIFAIRRALSTVYTERGVYSSLHIEHKPIMPTLVCKSMIHTPPATEKFVLKGRAYSFAVSGDGSFSIEDKSGTVREFSFSSPLYVWRGFFEDTATLRFFGDHVFEVFSLAEFEYTRSNRSEDIFLYGEPFEYRIGELRNDFHSFAAFPTDRDGNEIREAEMRGDKLIIPWGFEGRIDLIYKVRPPEISADAPDEQIMMPAEIEHLIPLLSASYYWADDAPDKAEYYLSLYGDAMRAVKQFDTRRLGGGYKDVTGWAK